LIKTVLVLEKGVIPPNANFVNLNPKIDVDFLRIKLPQEPTKWPSAGVRRASVNSFGFGGSNTHVIVDDAYHYLSEAGIEANHNTIIDPSTPQGFQNHINIHGVVTPPPEDAMEDISFSFTDSPKLVVLSAKDEATLALQSDTHTKFLQDTHIDDEFSSNFVYTLNERRNHFPWRAAAVINSPRDLNNFSSLLSKSNRAGEEPALCFVFTGQGAQYPAQILRTLEDFEVFRLRMDEAEACMTELGCPWSVREELYKPTEFSRINDAEFCQPLSTIVQIALVDLLRSFGVYPSVVVGHSSGEIAAAYCSGALSARSAIKVAFFRGYHSANLAASGAAHGTMMAASLSVQEAQSYLDELAQQTGVADLTVACINSPKSVTISGGRGQIDLLESMLSEKGIFARKLNVNMAYHSTYMQAVAKQYYNSIMKLERGTAPLRDVTMVSTVTGCWVPDRALRNPQYWVDNMISPVQFSPAVEKLTFSAHRKVWKRLDCSHRDRPRATFLLEVGFHGALRGPLRDILGSVQDGGKVKYDTVLVRNQSPTKTLLASLGQLFCHGCPVDLAAVNAATSRPSKSAPKILCDLPEYAFNHSKSYWEEGRIGKQFRLEERQKLDLLGKPSPDWNKAEAKWRNFIRTSEMPWVEDHKINGSMIYPGAGMLVMAIEAANQSADPSREIEGFELKDVKFLSALPIPRTPNGIETHLYLRQSREGLPWSEFRIFCFENEEWIENCRGTVRVHYHGALDGIDAGSTAAEKVEELNMCLAHDRAIPDLDIEAFDHDKLYDALRKSGYDFGSSFQLLRNGMFANKEGRADVQLYEWPADTFPQQHIIHPCTLDAILHLTVASYAEGGCADVPTAIPSSLRRLWVAKDGLSCTQAKSVRNSARLIEHDSRGVEYNLSVVDDACKRVLVRGEGLQLTIVARHAEPEAPHSDDENQICYQLDWQPLEDDVIMTNGHSNGANGHSNGVSPESQPIVVADLSSKVQKEISSHLASIVSEEYLTMSLTEAANLGGKEDRTFIFLEELERARLMDLPLSEYALLRDILTKCRASLWVMNGGGPGPQEPTVGVANGLFRVLRNERPEVPYATLALDTSQQLGENQAYLIHKVFQKIAAHRDPASHEQEFVEKHGVLHVPRVVEAKEITESIYEGTLDKRTSTQRVGTCPPVQLSIESTGFLDTLHFTEDDVYHEPLQPDEVEIKVCAAGLNMRDVLIALGRVPGTHYGSEAAGIVTRVGSQALNVVPGDRVIMARANFRTFARAKAHLVQKLDPSMAFAEAVCIPSQFCTAWYSLVELARLEADESVLIHTGAGGTGQAAIQVAQYIGATIYTTVGSPEKKQLLMQEYGIPESHIFYSRNTSFAKGVMRMTGGRGVDVVLNSLAGDSLVASWECIAPYGRFVEIGKKDILQNSGLPMSMFRKNASFHCFDGFALQGDRPKVYTKAFEKVLRLFKEGSLNAIRPLHIFPIGEVEDAFRALQEGKLAGKIVLEVSDDMEIKTTLRNQPSLSIGEASTYVIAGGLGGIGRNVARWLVERGATHLLLLSRSGARDEKAQSFIEELSARGVVARAPPCDVTDYHALQQVIEQCSHDMPPIKGCVQGSMVLRVRCPLSPSILNCLFLHP
jgi:acyl transferase domain-containing protein/NADPH:quinone reductase-like Zn-dependent oxidoreductase